MESNKISTENMLITEENMITREDMIECLVQFTAEDLFDGKNHLIDKQMIMQSIIEGVAEYLGMELIMREHALQ